MYLIYVRGPKERPRICTCERNFVRARNIAAGRVRVLERFRETAEDRSPDDAFIYKESIDLGTYERQRDRLREELTLVEIDRHGSKVEEFDVEGILNFAERVLPRASDLWIQASLEQRQRLQRLFFPEGVAFSGKAFDRTVVTSSLFEYLRPPDVSNENLWTRPGSLPLADAQRQPRLSTVWSARLSVSEGWWTRPGSNR